MPAVRRKTCAPCVLTGKVATWQRTPLSSVTDIAWEAGTGVAEASWLGSAPNWSVGETNRQSFPSGGVKHKRAWKVWEFRWIQSRSISKLLAYVE